MVVELQKGNPEILTAWNILCDLSRAFFIKIYDRLDIKNNEFGESYYKDKIPGVLDELRAKDLVKMDKGALCMYIPGKKQPLMLIKSDGGFNYDTTDMAAAFHRLVTLKAQRCIYITDVGQQPHFELIFEGAKLAGWHTPPKNKMEHMGFGLVLSENGEKMKTRNGKNVKLMDLLDEAKDKAKSELDTRTGHEEDEAQAQDDSKRRTQLTPEEIDRASEILGIAAVKYFDLRQSRIQNYKFDLSKMCSQKGDTAVYLIYSYIRLCSILRKSGKSDEEIKAAPFEFTHAEERQLARHIAKFDETIELVVENLTLNRLCEFLYNLARKVAEAYSAYKILNNEDSLNRLKLILITRDMMKKCFFLLGIQTIDRI